MSAPASLDVEKLSNKGTRKKWNPKMMEDTMAAVRNGQMTATVYNVPKSTLHD